MAAKVFDRSRDISGVIEDRRSATIRDRTTRSAIPLMIKASAGGGGKGMRDGPFRGKGSREGFARARSQKRNRLSSDDTRVR